MIVVWTFLRELFGLFRDGWKAGWLAQIVPPWRNGQLPAGKDGGPLISPAEHWVFWLVGWLWTIAGAFLGAAIAPSLVSLVEPLTAYEEEFTIAVAVLIGFIIQFVGFLLQAIPGTIFIYIAINHTSDEVTGNAMMREYQRSLPFWAQSLLTLLTLALCILPLVLVGVLLNLYLSLVSEGQRVAVITLGATALIKVFIISRFLDALKERGIKAFKRWIGTNGTSKSD